MLQSLVEEAHVHEDASESPVCLIGVRIQRQRPSEFPNGPVVGEAL